MLCGAIVIRMMKTNEIRSALVLNGVKVKDIADQCKVKQPSVSAVIAMKRPTFHIREAIAKAIKKPYSDVWPEAANKKGRDKDIPSVGRVRA